MFEGPEKKFQKHIADFLIREHGFAVLTQDEITDTEFYFAEDHLYAFLKATQRETLERLEVDYGSDSRDEIFKALREEIGRRPLWSIIRTGLSVRGHDFKLYFPKPRSSESVANQLYGENRITFIPELVIKGAMRPDFGFFLNGLPIVTMELKHEANQNVHDAVAQYVSRDHSDRIFQLPFLHIAADTSDVQVATDPRAEKNFRWFNTGLTNQAADGRRIPGGVPLPRRSFQGQSAGSRFLLPRPGTQAGSRRGSPRASCLHALSPLPPAALRGEDRTGNSGAFR